MTKTAKNRATREEASPQLVLGLAEIVREDLRAFVVTAGVAALTVLLEKETDGGVWAALPASERSARAAGRPRSGRARDGWTACPGQAASGTHVGRARGHVAQLGGVLRRGPAP